MLPWHGEEGIAPPMTRATHISIVHGPGDIRIFEKQCRTLAAAGYDVHLVVAGPPASELDGVHLHALAGANAQPPTRRRRWRLVRAARHALALRPSLFHLHDPELIPLGLFLKLLGAQVIYDVHEDHRAHARTTFVGRPLRGWGRAARWCVLEALARRAFDGFVCASPALAGAFPAARTAVVGNFPLHRRFDPAVREVSARPYAARPNRLVYSGQISEVRGLREMLAALALLPDRLDCRLRLVGAFEPAVLERSARELPGWDRVDFLPQRPHSSVIGELHGARAGLVLLRPLPNHFDAIRSNKLFEYMAAGIPVIASDLPEWRRIVAGTGCGLVADPLDPAAIAGAIERLLTDPAEAESMGRRGRAAVARELNWDAEAGRLLALYEGLRGRRPTQARRTGRWPRATRLPRRPPRDSRRAR